MLICLPDERAEFKSFFNRSSKRSGLIGVPKFSTFFVSYWAILGGDPQKMTPN